MSRSSSSLSEEFDEESSQSSEGDFAEEYEYLQSPDLEQWIQFSQQLSPEEFQQFISLDDFYAFRNAVEESNIEVARFLFDKIDPQRLQEMIAADDFRVLRIGRDGEEFYTRDHAYIKRIAAQKISPEGLVAMLVNGDGTVNYGELIAMNDYQVVRMALDKMLPEIVPQPLAAKLLELSLEYAGVYGMNSSVVKIVLDKIAPVNMASEDFCVRIFINSILHGNVDVARSMLRQDPMPANLRGLITEHNYELVQAAVANNIDEDIASALLQEIPPLTDRQMIDNILPALRDPIEQCRVRMLAFIVPRLPLNRGQLTGLARLACESNFDENVDDILAQPFEIIASYNGTPEINQDLMSLLENIYSRTAQGIASNLLQCLQGEENQDVKIFQCRLVAAVEALKLCQYVADHKNDFARAGNYCMEMLLKNHQTEEGPLKSPKLPPEILLTTLNNMLPKYESGQYNNAFYCEEIRGQAAAIAQISQGVLRSYKDTSRPLTAVDILNKMDASVNSIFANRHRVANASQRGVEASLAADLQLERIQLLRGLLAELRGEGASVAAAAAASGSPSSPQFSSLSQDLGRSSRA